jgi:hypothetical protein
MELTKEAYEFIDSACNDFNESPGYDVDVNAFIYSYLYSDDKCFRILNDWDEGKGNDPFWNNELNEHSVIVFIKKMYALLLHIYHG